MRFVPCFVLVAMAVPAGLEAACGVEVLHNSVFSTQAPFSSIEWRFPATGGRAANNLASHDLRPRDGAVLTTAGNVTNAAASVVVSVSGNGRAGAWSRCPSAVSPAWSVLAQHEGLLRIDAK